MNMKKKVKIIIGIIIFICLVFITVCYVVNNRSKDVNSKVVIGQTKDDSIKNGVKNIEDIINNDTTFTSGDADTIDQFIDKYKDEDLVKNDLVIFVMTKDGEYVNSGEGNKNLFNKLNYILKRLCINYPENTNISDVQKSLYTLAVERGDTVPTKLTSPDGMLELESSSSGKQYVIGTIKNLSNEPYRYVEVNINLYDSENNQVDSTMSNINNLAEYGTWNFKAIIINQKEVFRYKIVSIEGIR